MTSRRMVWVSSLAFAGFALLGTSGRTALAKEPPEADLVTTAAPTLPEAKTTLTAEQAAAKAQAYLRQVEWYRTLGGVASKSSLARWVEGEAAHFAAEAVRLSAPALPPSAEAEHFRALAATHRWMGGAAYKAGLVQRAEELTRRYEPAVVVVPPPETALGRHLRYGKPIEAFLNGR
jgi:hypothetical protein